MTICLILILSCLRELKQWYEENKKEYDHIVFVVGGGGLSRNMEQKVSETINNVNSIHEIYLCLLLKLMRKYFSSISRR
jgi:hypothetical protein